MIIKCTSCGSRYRVGDDLVAEGPKRFKCKNCGAVLLIKPPAAVTAPPDEKPVPEKPAPLTQAPAATPPAADSGGSRELEDKAASGKMDQWDEAQGTGNGGQDYSGLKPEEIAARQQQDIQEKLEKRRQQMEDEISGRLNKAALETLDFEVLSELAHKLQGIQNNPDFIADPETKLFSCIKCKATFCIYPDDARTCSNCAGEVSLVRADDILKQFGMFG